MNKASILKYINLTGQNCKDNIGNGFVHGLSLYL